MENMTTFETTLLVLAAICVIVLVVLAVRVVRFLDHLDGTISRIEHETLPAIKRLSSILERLDLLTEEVESAYRSTRKRVDALGISPLLRILKWLPFRTGMLPPPFNLIFKALISGAKAFRSIWGTTHKGSSGQGPASPPGSPG